MTAPAPAFAILATQFETSTIEAATRREFLIGGVALAALLAGGVLGPWLSGCASGFGCK